MCAWVASAASLPRFLLPFKMWLKRTHEGVLPYGKYKNRFFSEVFLEHPEYAEWACELRERELSAIMDLLSAAAEGDKLEPLLGPLVGECEAGEDEMSAEWKSDGGKIVRKFYGDLMANRYGSDSPNCTNF